MCCLLNKVSEGRIPKVSKVQYSLWSGGLEEEPSLLKHPESGPSSIAKGITNSFICLYTGFLALQFTTTCTLPAQSVAGSKINLCDTATFSGM